MWQQQEEYTKQYTPYGMLTRFPDNSHYWFDVRLYHKKSIRYRNEVDVIFSPKDANKLAMGQVVELWDLELRATLDNTVYLGDQVKGVCYNCQCVIFFYKERRACPLDHPKTCPLGHPAREEI